MTSTQTATSCTILFSNSKTKWVEIQELIEVWGFMLFSLLWHCFFPLNRQRPGWSRKGRDQNRGVSVCRVLQNTKVLQARPSLWLHRKNSLCWAGSSVQWLWVNKLTETFLSPLSRSRWATTMVPRPTMSRSRWTCWTLRWSSPPEPPEPPSTCPATGALKSLLSVLLLLLTQHPGLKAELLPFLFCTFWSFHFYFKFWFGVWT